MKLSIENGVLRADGMQLCYVKARNGRDPLQSGRYTATTQFSHAHGQELPNAGGLGWIGPSINSDVPECDVVLGRVLKGFSSDSLLPCSANVGRLLAMLETAESSGKTVELVVS